MSYYKKNSILALAAIALLTVSVLPANAATKATTPKPTATASARTGGSGGFGGFGGFGGGGNSAAFAKYSACLAKAGIKFPGFGGGRGFGGGTRPTGVRPTGPTGAPGAPGAPGAGANGGAPRPRPTFSLTAAQQKAFTACAALRPSFGGFGPGTGKPGGTTPNGKDGTTAPKTGTSAAYIACLNTRGLPVHSAVDIAGLDNQNTRVIAAEKACAGK